MALLYLDGFDHYNTAGTTNYIYSASPTLWINQQGSSDVIGSARINTMPVLGGRCLSVIPNGEATVSSTDGKRLGHPALLMPVAPASGLTFGCGFHFYSDSWSTGSVSNIPAILGFCIGSNPSIKTLGVSSTGQLSWRNGNANDTSLGDSGSNVLSTNTLYHIEVKILFHATAGTVDVRVNGVSFMSLSGIATLPTSATHLVFSPLGYAVNAQDNTKSFYYANLYIWDATGSINNTFFGERTVQTIYPNADTATAAWTKSTGSNGYDLINDVPDNPGSNYLESSTLNDASVFDMASLSNTNVQIIGIQTIVKAEKTDAGTGGIQVGPRISSTDDLSANQNVSQSTYRHFSKVSELNPATGLPWTVSDIAAVQLKVVRSA